jgi:hypothetical protein
MVSESGNENDRGFIRLSPRQSQLLYWLTVLERNREPATRKNLAKLMDTSVSNVSFLAAGLTAANYVRAYPHEGGIAALVQTERRPGRLPVAYYLQIQRVISLPETARMALEGFRLSRGAGTWTRRKLISHMVERYGLLKNYAEERLDFCLSTGYLATEGKKLSAGERIMAEIGYLKLLARGCRAVHRETRRTAK